MEKSPRFLANAEQTARQTIFDCVSPAIAELAERAFAAGESVHYVDYALLKTIKANVDNSQLTDAEFREFVRNSTKD